jgi:gliding motility-associated-like protein
MKHFIFLILTVLSIHLGAQTLIMNEVSNGPSGNQEYVEFVVASNTVTYSCTNTTPPCIDIRGWIFDDNSGYHGSAGIASGAIRFSQDPIWACVPLGTIILIYNGADRNPAIPPDDISMADGNCTIIAPVSNASLFEVNSTTPGASSCSYPATGWVAGGNWNNTLLANPGDCARVVNLSGCEVFSVCWGTDNQNNLIYFAGAGGQKVYYFNGNDPTIQSNWTSGSASPSPGAQTPGAANNAANAAYIGQFNNNCMPITPIAMSTPTTVNAGCSCNGSASVTASGSIGPYTYVWYDAGFTPIGQTAATATGLCAGVYKVIATSHIGCSDTATVTIGSTGAAVTLAVNSETICSGNSVVLTATASTTGGTYSWTPGGQTTQSISVNPSSQTIYTVAYTVSGCSATAVSTVAINASPTASVTSSNASLCSSGQSATLTLSGSTGTYSWSNGATTSTTSVNTPGIYTATVSTAGCGNAMASVTIAALPNPTVSITAGGPTQICSGSSVVLTANSSETNYLWSDGTTTQTISVSTTTTIVVTSTNSCGSAQDSETITVTPLPTVTVSPNTVSLCSGQSATVQAIANMAVTYTWSTGANTNTVSLNVAGIYTVDVSNICGAASATVDVSSSSVPTLTAATSQSAICNSGQTALLSLTGSTGTYSWSNGATTSTVLINTPGVYTATVTTAGCGTATASVIVAALPSPTVFISAPTTSLCPGSHVILTANSSEGNYLWSNGATTQTISANFPNVTVTTTNSCGSASATQTLVFVSLPTLTITPGNVLLCPGITATLTANGSATNYTWSTGATGSTIYVNTPGVKTVSVSNSCGIKAVSVNVTPLNFSPLVVTPSSPTVCPNELVTYVVTGGGFSASGTTTYDWSNSSSTGSVVTAQGGTVTVSNTNLCGTYTTSVSVGINPVTANIVADPVSGTSPLVVTFTDNSTNAGTWLWDFGNGTIANTQTVANQVYANSGSYTAYLTVTNGSCMDVDSVVIIVLEEEPTLYVPNAFTPNGDSINDIFRVGYTNIIQFNMIIFDRWGLKLFESSDIDNGWDGKVNGNVICDGVYYYLIDATGIDEVKIKKQGTVTLFK